MAEERKRVEDELSKINEEMAEIKEMLKSKRTESFEDTDPDEYFENDFDPEIHISLDDKNLGFDEEEIGTTISEYLSSVIEGVQENLKRSVDSMGQRFHSMERNIGRDFAREMKRDPEFREKKREVRRKAKEIGRKIRASQKDMHRQFRNMERRSRKTGRGRQVIHIHEFSEEELDDFFNNAPALMSAIADPRRLKLLKLLENGPAYQGELSEQIGVKGGTFKHHMESLMSSKFVHQETTRGRYLITQLGVEALKLAEIVYKRFTDQEKEFDVKFEDDMDELEEEAENLEEEEQVLGDEAENIREELEDLEEEATLDEAELEAEISDADEEE
ncbi:MAG: ArsR family transcriptional regulator [Candidatus Heimdallarchaeota archaeon]|nr:ArsR family transcriptional regulator [Candidatus Heimdallarchaeota archaeon]